jgi:hypothetical protein
MSEILTVAAPEADWDRMRPMLDEAILDLNERDREALLLRFFEGLGFSAIGARLLITDKGAHKRVERALDRLRDRLVRRGITSSSAALSATLITQAGTAAPVGLAGVVTSSALASHGQSASAASLIHLMTTTKTAIGLAAAAVVLSLVSATYELRRKIVAEAALASTSQTNAALVMRVKSLQQSSKAQEDRRAESLTKTAAAATGPTAGSGSSGPGSGSASEGEAVDPATAGKAFLESHPEVEAALVARSRARAVARYGALFEALGLNPAQVGQFEDIIMQRETLGMPTMIYQVGPTAATPAQVESQLQAFLGPAGYSEYQGYMQTMAIHQANAELASALYYTDSPLSGGQASQLEQTFGTAMASGLNGPQSWSATFSKAEAILAAPQLAAFVAVAKSHGFEPQSAGGLTR